MKQRLALFDLDHTLLDGDSDVLWCEFLIRKGLLDRATFSVRNAEMEAAYKAGTVDAADFAGFYVSTLAGRPLVEWEPLRKEFLRDEIVPRVPDASVELVRKHLACGDLVVMTTATNRFITEYTAAHLGIQHLLATEVEVVQETFSGRPTGVLNMRAGKVTRLHAWLAERGESLDVYRSIAYSDSMNDLPLLEAADEAVVVNGDARLVALAAERGWSCIALRV